MYCKIAQKITPKFLFHDCDVFGDLVPFVQFKKCGKNTWTSITFIKVVRFKPTTLLKVTFLHSMGVFHVF